MGIPLAEALAQVDLEVGRTYHCQVNGWSIELRVLPLLPEHSTTIPPEFLPAPLQESDIMLDAWVELPRPKGEAVVRARPGKLPLPSIPDIPSDEEPT